MISGSSAYFFCKSALSLSLSFSLSRSWLTGLVKIFNQPLGSLPPTIYLFHSSQGDKQSCTCKINMILRFIENQLGSVCDTALDSSSSEACQQKCRQIDQSDEQPGGYRFVSSLGQLVLGEIYHVTSSLLPDGGYTVWVTTKFALPLCLVIGLCAGNSGCALPSFPDL